MLSNHCPTLDPGSVGADVPEGLGDMGLHGAAGTVSLEALRCEAPPTGRCADPRELEPEGARGSLEEPGPRVGFSIGQSLTNIGAYIGQSFFQCWLKRWPIIRQS